MRSAPTRARPATPTAPPCSTTVAARQIRSAGSCSISTESTTPRALAQSDAICSALQLANFWQDLGVDAARGRLYVPAADAARHGVALADVLARRDSARLRALVAELVAWARALMLQGAPLADAIGGRAGWELRFVVQGGLRVLEKIDRLGGATLSTRPTIGWHDGPVLAWRALTMRPGAGRHLARAASAEPSSRRDAP